MKDDRHRILHGLGVLRVADAGRLAARTGLSAADVEAELARLEATGRVVAVAERWTLSPLARLALQSDYSRVYADVRDDAAFASANDRFEIINLELKALITDWQTVPVGGTRIANDHRDDDYDARIVDRLGRLHDRAEPVLTALSRGVAGLAYYQAGLATALDRVEAGDGAWVSDATIESYHTLWFELHEELIRILGGARHD